MKKLIITFLSILCIIFSVQHIVSASTLKSTKRVTLYVGDEKQLNTWKDNVKWAVSDKNCVLLSKTGKIQALKKGKVIITAKHKNKKKKFIITIKDSFLNVDFSNVARISVINLGFGGSVDVVDEDIIIIEKLFKENTFSRYRVVQKPKKGAYKYSILLFDGKDNQISSIAVNDKEVRYDGASYKARYTLDLSFFNTLFQEV